MNALSLPRILALLALLCAPAARAAAPADAIAQDLSAPLYEMNHARMLDVLREHAKRQPGITAFRVADTLVGDVPLVLWRANEELLHRFLSDFPPDLPRSPRPRSATIYRDDHPIGTLDVHFADVLHLTPAEIDYLSQNPILRIANSEWPPFVYRRHNEDIGYAVDLMRLLADRLGLRLQIVHGPPWKQFLDMVRKGEIDALPCIARTPERDQYLLFTAPFIRATDTVFVRRDRVDSIRSMDDLRDKRVAVIRGAYNESALRAAYPDVELLPFDNSVAILRAVASGQAHAAIESDRVGDFVLRREGLGHVVPAFEVKGDSFSLDLRIATSAQNPVLRDVLQKALASLTEREILDLSGRWFFAETLPSTALVFLTPEEEAYLASRGPIRMAVDPDYAPFERLDENRRHVGIAADLLALVQQRLGVQFELVPTQTWAESVELARNRQCDVLSFLNATPERSEFLSFTPPL